MKKIMIIPMLMLGAAFITSTANAEMVKGKVVTMKEGTVQVQPDNSTTPTTLKTTPKTKYFEKKPMKKEVAESDDVEVNEWVEVIYAIDPTTGDMLIEEIAVVDED